MENNAKCFKIELLTDKALADNVLADRGLADKVSSR